MSRVSKQIICQENEINILKSLISNPLSSSKLRSKAQVILMANEGKQSKEISKLLSIRESTVGLWRNKYLSSGINSLYGAERSGRRGNNAPNIRKEIALKAQSIYDSEEEWSIDSLAKEYNTSTDTVRRAFKDANVPTIRKRNWEIQTNSLVTPKSISIVGIYLSDTENAIVLKADSNNNVLSSQGIIQTKNSQNAKVVENLLDEKECIEVVQILNELTDKGVNTFKGRRIGICEFVNNISSSLNKLTDSKIYIIAQRGENVTNQELKYPNIGVTIVPDISLWLDNVNNWLTPLSSNCQEILNAIKKYVIQTTGKEPFVWMSKLFNQDNMSNNQMYKKNITRINFSIETVDGITINKTLTFKDILPSTTEMSYDSLLQFASGVGQVEEGAASALKDVSKEIIQSYTSEINKKKL